MQIPSHLEKKRKGFKSYKNKQTNKPIKVTGRLGFKLFTRV